MFRPRAQIESSRISKASPNGMFSISVDVKLVGPLWTPGIFKGIVDRANKNTLSYGKAIIQRRTPVDTGNLRSKWMVTDSEIRNDEYYAAFVEYGTIFMDGYFMATDSIEEIEKRYLENIQNELKSSIGAKVGSLLGRRS